MMPGESQVDRPGVEFSKMNFARELTLRAIQCQNQLAFVKSVFTNLDRKALLVCPKIRNWKFDIGRCSLHPI